MYWLRGNGSRADLSLLWWLLCVTFVFLANPLFGYESDQHSNRLPVIEDSLEPMNRFVNQHLQQIIEEWQGPRDEVGFARKVYDHLGSWYWVDKMERWAMTSPQLSRYPQRKYQSIYRGMPIWATRVNYLFGVGAVNQLNGVRVGTDKFGHFFSQGLKYFMRDHRGWDLARILKRGAFAERWLFGQLTTGVYSNADLVANYEGYLFYAGLSKANVIPGREALIGWEGDTPFLQRQFTWRDHVNDYWDEALNPSYLTGALQKRMVPAIQRLCDQYRGKPTAFVPDGDPQLWQRYARLGLHDARHNRFDHICSLLVAD